VQKEVGFMSSTRNSLFIFYKNKISTHWSSEFRLYSNLGNTTTTSLKCFSTFYS